MLVSIARVRVLAVAGSSGANTAASIVVDAFRDVRGSGGSAGKSKNLSELFSPPVDLLFPGTFAEVASCNIVCCVVAGLFPPPCRAVLCPTPPCCMTLYPHTHPDMPHRIAVRCRREMLPRARAYGCSLTCSNWRWGRPHLLSSFLFLRISLLSSLSPSLAPARPPASTRAPSLPRYTFAFFFSSTSLHSPSHQRS